MKENGKITLTGEQLARIARIKQYDAGCRGAFGQQMGYAFLSGAELNALKEELPHGAWIPAREEFFPEIPARTATRYMSFAEQIGHGVADLPSWQNIKLLGNGAIPDNEKENILKAVHDLADGKTLTQLYRDLGVIREAQKPGTYERKPRDLKKLIDAAGEVDDSALKDWCGDTLMMLDPKTCTLGEQKTALLQRMETIRLQLGHAIQKILKSRGAKTKGLKAP